MNTFLSGMAVLLSTLALACGGYAAYEVFTLRQMLNTTNTASNTPTQASSPVAVTASPLPATTPVTTNTSEIQPGKFVQPAFGNKAEVELLSVKRIKDPETNNRDVVNVQMRVRRLTTDSVGGGSAISIASTSARNPETSETYKGVAFERSTGSVALYQLRPNSSADAYVWVRVPEGVSNLDIFVPDTACIQKRTNF